MAKRNSPNDRPWLANLIFDFKPDPSASPSDSEAFIRSLPTSEKYKEFLRLRYRDGQAYTDIDPAYGISAGGIRQTIKYPVT